MQWTQAYTPIGGNLLLSALAALVPIIFFFWALAIKRMKGYTAGLATLGIALIIAVLVYRMPHGKSADVRDTRSRIRIVADRLDHCDVCFFV